jgi:aldehyde dehydrogenase (NAD+)
MNTSSDQSVETQFLTLIQKQRAYIRQGNSDTFEKRRKVLLKLRALIKENEDAIIEAMSRDMGRPETEAYGAEILYVYMDIDHQLRHLREWMRPQNIATSLFNQPGSSQIIAEPYGSVLVIAPWNYPVQLLLSPAIGALAAGNSVVLKPSEISRHTEKLMTELINRNFPPELLHVINGGPEETTALIDAEPDYLFFTGSTHVGRIIARQAGDHLIPVTLELGGKSPCIIHKDAKLPSAAKRILWGKCYNAGQTCIAPDYLMVHETILEDFLEHFKKAYTFMYGGDAVQSADYSRIITQRHYERLKKMVEGEVIFGGKYDDERLTIEPTLILNPDEDHPAMQEEIFGPVLPVFTYQDEHEVIDRIQRGSKPLAMYIFSGSNTFCDKIITHTSAGGVLINDTLLHIASHALPFGGVGDSGIGRYHGKYSFETFSHLKPVMRKKTWPNPSIRFAPYKQSWRPLEKILLWLAK